MNIDMIESMTRSLSNTDVINMSLSGSEMNDMLKHVIKKRRIDAFTSSLEKTLRLAHNTLIFTNRAIADKMFMSESEWMPSAIMDDILEKLVTYMEPTFEVVEESLSYDDQDPHIEFSRTIDDFVVSLSFAAGISCTTYRPVYDWHGVSLSGVDIYTTSNTLLMSWSKKYNQRTDTISYTRDDTNFISREHTHPIRDTTTRFDLFEMTPPQDKRDIDSDDDNERYCHLFDSLISVESIDQVINADHEYYAHASAIKKTMDTVFFQPRNCIEEIMYKSADVVSKFLLRYQTWSTCDNDGYVHAREFPEWFEHSFDVFVDELKTFSEKLFGEWVCDRDYINNGYDRMWTFTRKMYDAVFVVTFGVIEGGFSWDLMIDEYSVYMNALSREYSVSIDLDTDDFEEDVDGKRFEQKKLDVLFKTIGFEKTPAHSRDKINHFTEEELDIIIH